MRKTASSLSRWCILSIVLGAVAACGGSDGDTNTVIFGGDGAEITTDPDDTDTDGSGDTGSGTGGSGSAGVQTTDWTSGYVSYFQQSAVDNIRSMAQFQSHFFDGLNALSVIRADYALSTGLTGQGQVIAIVDDGVRTSHAAFADTTITFHPDSDQNAGRDHGTAVASVAVGNGTAIMGVAPKADLYVGSRSYLSALDWQQEASFVDGAREAGAVVLNNSWGLGDTFSFIEFRNYFASPEVRPYVTAVKKFAQDGVVVFSLSNDPEVPNAFGLATLPMIYPELEPSWITVIDLEPEYSGDRVVSANIVSASCQETAAYCLGARGYLWMADDVGDATYSFGEGTSFVAPQVSGAMALLAEAFPDLTPQQLRARLLMTADNSFFDHTGKVTFAPGYEHGYSYDYGHGIMDLRAALLPIGDVTVPLSRDGAGINLTRGQVGIVTSPVVGQSLAQKLSDIEIMARDGLDGTFVIGADALVAARPMSVDPMDQIKGLVAANTNGTANLGAGNDDTFAAIGFAQTAVPFNEGQLRLLDNGSDSFGLGLTQAYETDLGRFELGVTSLREVGSVLGLSTTVSGDHLSGTTVGFDLGYRFDWGHGRHVSIAAHIGQTRADRDGTLAQFETLRYDAIGLTFAQALGKNRQFSFSLAQPPAVSGGAIHVTVPTYSRAGAVSDSAEFSTHRVSLVPHDRQIDAQLQYHQDLGRNTQIALGIKHSENHGHVAQSRDTKMTFGIDVQF